MRPHAPLFLLLVLFGCDDGVSARSHCNQVADMLCRKTLQCLTLAELADRGIPADQDACVTVETARMGCDSLNGSNACGPGTSFDEGVAATCIDDLAALSCATIENNDIGPLFLDSCAGVCLPDDRLGLACSMDQPEFCGDRYRCGFVLRDADSGAGDFACVPGGSRGEGDACTAPTNPGESDDCSAGLVCWAGGCHRYCDEANPCAADQSCLPSPMRSNYFDLCAQSCSLVEQDCGAGMGCYWYNLSYAICRPAGDMTGVCEEFDDCVPGSTCSYPVNGHVECADFCDAAQYADRWAPGCASNEICWSLEVVGDYPVISGLGICAPPG